MTVKGNVRRVQQAENSAAEKAGLRMILLDEARLLGKDGAAYAREVVASILEDVTPELKESASLGIGLAKIVKGAAL
jgi:hypothetical protein